MLPAVGFAKEYKEVLMSTVEWIREVAQIAYYIAISISGPLALIGYLRAKKKEQEEREYKTFDELDNKFLEYQKLALLHDIDLIDVPDGDPILAGDTIRKKQLLVASAISFSLFQRAFLMFHHQADHFKSRQWPGWEQFLTKFLTRDNVKDAWQIGKSRYDLRFQQYVDHKIVENMKTAGVEGAAIYAFEKTGLLIREYNEHLASGEDLARWNAAIKEYRARARKSA
jgi:hypothetical protein